MKTKKLLAVLALCTALLLGGCGTAVPSDGGAGPENGIPAAAEKGVPAAAEDEAEEEPAPDAGDPSTEPVESGLEAQNAEKLAQIAGTWYVVYGAGSLVIWENGRFVLDGGEQYEGWLSYTEDDDGSLWASGPRYELYLDSGEKVPNTFLLADENRPGELDYCVGGGAETFFLDGPAPEVQTREVRVRVVSADELSGLPEHDAFSAYTGDYPVYLLFTAAEPVSDFRFLSIDYHYTEDEDLPQFDVEELYRQADLSRPLLVTAYFPGDLATNGFSYVNGNGVTQYVSVNLSGYDGSLVTWDFMPYMT